MPAGGDESLCASWLKRVFPPMNTRTFVAHYVPASGSISHALFSVHIFSPSLISRYFPVGELAVSNTILFNANIGIGFYVFFRQHMHKLSSWDRVEFAVFASTMFNFGSLLTAVLVKALLPTNTIRSDDFVLYVDRTSTITKSFIAVLLSVFLQRTGRKYIKHIDTRSVRSPSSSRVHSLKPYGRESPRPSSQASGPVNLLQVARGATPELSDAQLQS